MKIRLFLLFPFLLLLSGCLHPSELKDTAIVGAVAVDYRQEEFFLTMQIFDPTAGGSQNNVNLDALTNKTLAVPWTNPGRSHLRM